MNADHRYSDTLKKKRKCQMCGVIFECPDSWDIEDYTIIQKVLGPVYNIATLCRDCTPKYFRTHHAGSTRSAFPCFISIENKEATNG